MSTEMQALREEVQQLKQQHQQAERRYRYSERRFRVLGGLAVAAVAGAILIAPGNRAAIAQSSITTLQQIFNRLSALETKTQFVSIGKDGEMHIVGTNLHIENGLGATNGNLSDPYFGVPVVNGKGNLIIGYNETRTGPPFSGSDDRSGSHNLIVGIAQNYSSVGGIDVGVQNTISGAYASVIGGFLNTASGSESSVSGGDLNIASGVFSSVSGGIENTASGEDSSVSGGQVNTARGGASSVSGGEQNIASSGYSSVSGGFENTASGEDSSVSGGSGINQSGIDAWSGGTFHSP